MYVLKLLCCIHAVMYRCVYMWIYERTYRCVSRPVHCIRMPVYVDIKIYGCANPQTFVRECIYTHIQIQIDREIDIIHSESIFPCHQPISIEVQHSQIISERGRQPLPFQNVLFHQDVSCVRAFLQQHHRSTVVRPGCSRHHCQLALFGQLLSRVQREALLRETEEWLIIQTEDVQVQKQTRRGKEREANRTDRNNMMTGSLWPMAVKKRMNAGEEQQRHFSNPVSKLRYHSPVALAATASLRRPIMLQLQ